MVARRISLVTALVLLPLSWRSIAGARVNDTDRLDRVLADNGFRIVSMERARTNLFVRAKINGRTAALVIDTGSPVTALDRKNVGGYGVKEQETSRRLNAPAGHSSEHVGVGFVRIELANTTLANEKVAVVNLSAMNRGSPIYAGGVFGLDSMRKLGAIIDCGQSTLFVHAHGGTSQSQAKLIDVLTDRGFTRVPMWLNSSYLPAVTCRINTVGSNLIVETAAFTTILEKNVALRAGVRLTETGDTAEGAGNMRASISSGIARVFALGRFQTHNQKLSAQKADFAVLGIDYLRAHDAVIDCSGLNLFLR
jgi:hypothetical protein